MINAENLRNRLLSLHDDKNWVDEVNAYIDINNSDLKPFSSYYINKLPNGRLRLTLDLGKQSDDRRKLIYFQLKSKQEIQIKIEEFSAEWLNDQAESFENEYKTGKTTWQNHMKRWNEIIYGKLNREEIENYKGYSILQYEDENGYRVDFGTKRSKLLATIEEARKLIDYALSPDKWNK